MAKIVIQHDIAAAPDNLNTRTYQAGEEHIIGSELMPEWLADNLVTSGHASHAKGKVSKDATFYDVSELPDTGVTPLTEEQLSHSPQVYPEAEAPSKGETGKQGVKGDKGDKGEQGAKGKISYD